MGNGENIAGDGCSNPPDNSKENLILGKYKNQYTDERIQRIVEELRG